ncbi:SDR family oxidoreductase [Croceicoccus ponticola]|uniref:SDR family oxidoreductase n=1 Tax=Croceicoccus ponticola TaxID=2217664 RepID=A0A437GZX0_9SPHN|nr:SDR family oxidoreductase [Croceicoccus ponticola]RVQ68900.1 SDR family oxidoreductase [Croceicoccus ponticola]
MPEDAHVTRPAVLVTGAARRLGAAIARRFADDGWHVVIHYRRSAQEAEHLAAQLPCAETIGFDLANTGAVAAGVADLAARLREWRTVVNCASLFEFDSATAIDARTFDRAMQVNAEAPVVLAQRFLATAKASAGRCVINVLDQKLANINPDFFSYTMAKAALGAATQMLAIAHRDSDDRIYGLSPGAMLPSFDQEPGEHQDSGRMNLLQRLTDPTELADAAVFLAGGTLASGQVVHVDSGQHLLEQYRDVLFLARENT